MPDTQTIRLLSEKKDSNGHLISDVYECLMDGEVFSTVSHTICGPYKWNRVVFIKPQENFNCEFGIRMTVKTFIEKSEASTGRVVERSYETPDGSTLKRDYITGQCTSRGKNGTEVVYDTAMLVKMAELAGNIHGF